MVILPIINIYTGEEHHIKWRLSLEDPEFDDFHLRVQRFRECMYGDGWSQGDPIQLFKLPPYHYVYPRVSRLRLAETVVNFELKFNRFHNQRQVIVGRYFSFNDPQRIDDVWQECHEQARQRAKELHVGDVNHYFIGIQPAGEIIGVPDFYVPEATLKSLGSWNPKLNKV